MKTKSLLKNTLILGIGMVLPKLINLLTMSVYTRYVNAGEFGTLTYVTTVILSLLVPIITLQLENATFRFLIDTDKFENQSQYVTSAFVVISLMTLPTMLIAYFVPIGSVFSAWYYHLIVAMYVGVQTYVLFFRQTARGFGNNAAYSTSAVISVISNFVIMVVSMAVFNLGSLGYFLSLLFADVFSIIYLLFRMNYFKYIKLKYFDLKELKKMLKYSLPLIPNTISWFIINFFDQTIVMFLLGDVANGLLGTAHKIPNMFNTVYQAFNLAWTEHASRNINEKNLDSYYTQMFNTMLRLLCGAAIGLIAFSPLVFKILVSNPEYFDALDLMPMFVLATFLSCFSSFLGSIYVACKASKKVGSSSVAAATINIVVHLLTINTIGLYAAGFSSIVAFLVITIYRAIDINKHFYHIDYNMRLIGLCVILFAITMGLTYVDGTIPMLCNMAFATVMAYLLNRDMVKVIFKMVMTKLKPQA